MTAADASLFDRYKRHVLEGHTLAGVNIDEVFIRRFYTAVAEPDRDMVDGGANRGLHSVPMSRLLARGSGQVFSFEPIPAVADLLDAALREAGARNVTVLRRALSDHEGSAEFTWVRNLDGQSGILPRRHYSETPDIERIPVALTTLDAALAGRDPFFIKLDLEGGEFPALRGATGLLAQSRPVIAFENDLAVSAEIYGYGEADFFAFFAAQRYLPLDLAGQAVVPGNWRTGLLWQFLAVPEERAGQLLDLTLHIMAGTVADFDAR